MAFHPNTHIGFTTASLSSKENIYICVQDIIFPKPQILHSDLCNEIHHGPALTEWGLMKRLNPTLAFFPFWECHIHCYVFGERGESVGHH